jgi:radical SAM protein with 4Fe4S-binding SPASM domain
MADGLASAGVRALDLLGGEPTLHPRLGELVRALAARGLRCTLSTNGRGDRALLERLEDEVGRDALRIGVSVNDATTPAEVRAWILRRAPWVKSVCTRGWAPAPIVEEHLAREGSAFFLLYRDALTPEDLSRSLPFPLFMGRLKELQGRYPRASGVFCGGFVPELERSPELAAARCPAGTTKISVLPDGSAYPCYLLFRRPEFRLGNVFREPFERIWRHPALDFFRSFCGNPCPREECGHHTACHGGCPAVSLMIAGDLAAPDPRCAAD